MTYNFDPDKWYENELHYLKTVLKRGRITEKEFQARLRKLDQRHGEMWERLDVTYQVKD